MAADLGSVEFDVKADTSKLNDIVTAIGKVETAVNGLQSTFNSLGSKASSAASQASNSTSDLSGALESAATKGKLFADALETALSKAADLAKSAASALEGFVESSVKSYSSFEQAYDAANRYFNYSAEGVSGADKVMDHYNNTVLANGAHFKDIGVSTQDYFNLANTLVTRLATDNAEARAKMAYADKNGAIESVEARRNALDSELSLIKTGLQSQYDAKKDEYTKDEKLYKEQLDLKYEDDKNYWDKQLTNFKRANEDTYNARKAELDREEDELKQSLADELAIFKQAKSDEYDALKEALTNQYNQEKSMRSEARERLKQQLSDEYDDLKDSLDNQYSLLKDNLDKQIDAQERANQRAYDSRQRQLEDEYDELKRTLDKEVSAYQAATDARIKEIDREYTEKYKLIDEDKYKALKEIDDQIAALDKQTENESRASREREYNEKLSKLNLKKINADSQEERAQAEQDYNDTLADLQAYRHRNEVADEKEKLREKREATSKHYDDMKSDLQEQQKEEKDALKAQRAADLIELKEHNADILKEKKRANTDALNQLKQDQKDQIAAMKESEAQILSAEKDRNDSILKARKQANTDIVNQQKNDDEAFLRQLQSDNSNQLKEVKRANADEISERERSNKEKLSALQTANKNELTQLQRDLADQYDEYENNVNKKLKEIQRGYNDELQTMKDEHKKQLAEIQEHNRQVAEAESQRIKGAKKSLSEDDWKQDIDVGIEDQDYDKALEQIDTLMSNIQDATAATDKDNIMLSVLGGIYGRYATFDELNLPYRNKTGVQQMIQDAYADTRGLEEDPFAGLDVSADNTAAYLTALNWALEKYGVEGIAADEASNTLSGAFRKLQGDMENMTLAFSLNDDEAEKYGIDLNAILTDATADLENFLFGHKNDDGTRFDGLVQKVTEVLNNITTTIQENPEIPSAVAGLFSAAAGLIGPPLLQLVSAAATFIRDNIQPVVDAFIQGFEQGMPEDWSGTFGKVKDTIDGIHQAVTLLAPIIAGVFVFAEAAQGIAALSGIEGGLAALGGAFSTAAGTIGGVLSGIGTAITTAFGPILTGGSVSEAIGTFPAAIATAFGADAPAAAAIASFAGPAALGLLIVANQDVQRIAGEVFGGLAGIIGGAVDACSPILDTFKIAFEAAEGAISVIVRTVENALRPAFDQIVQWVGPVAETLKNDFKATWEQINTLLQTFVDTIGPFLGPLLEAIGDAVGMITEPLGAIVGFLGAGFLGILDGIVNLIRFIADGLTTLLGVLQPATTGIGELFSMLGDTFKNISDGFYQKFQGIIDTIWGFPQRVTEGLSKGMSEMEESGRSVIEGFQKGCLSYWEDVKKWWAELPDKVMNFITSGFDMHSPSKKMSELGNNVITGFFNGITEGWKPIAEFFGGILDKVKGFFNDPVGTLVGTGQDIIGGLKNGVDSAWEGVKKFFGGVEGDVQGDFNGSDKWLDKHGEQTMDGYKAGIDKSYQVVSTFFSSIDSNLGEILANSDKYLTEEGKEVIAGLKTGMDNQYTNVDAFFTDMQGKVKGKFDSADGWLKSGGGKTISGYKSGMTDKWQDVDSYLGGRASAVSDKFKNSDTILDNAGYNVISGFYSGLVDAWNNSGVKGFVTDIADWIKENKGPESKDKKLLVPAGNWIIGGLYGSMEDSFESDVMPFVESMSDQMKTGFDETLVMVKTLSKELDGEFSSLTEEMTEALEDLTERGKDALAIAGTEMMRGFVDALEHEWMRGKEFVYSIADWIKQNKGPREKDKKLLTPAGRWIMGGLRNGLEEAFRRDVMPFVSSMADEMERGFGNPMLVASADMLSTGANGMNSGLYGATAPQIVIQHMEVRNERDIHRVSRELNELWKMEMSGSLV